MTMLALGAAAVAAAVPTGRAASIDPLSSSALMSDVERYAALAPDHLTGTTDSARTQAWVAAQLRAAGLQTGADAFKFLRFTPQRVTFTVDGVSIPSIAPRFYSGTTPAAGISAPLAYAQYGTAQQMSSAGVQGKIAVIDVPTADTATEPTLDSAVAAAKTAGAVALVAVTEGPEDYPVQEDVDSRQGIVGLPTIFVGKRTGQAVISQAQAGTAANLTLQANVGPGCDSNVWGVLPGADRRRYIVVGTPTSGFDPAASERGAGVAMLLGLARHYAALPLSARPVTLVFVALTGHEAGFLGLPTFMQTRASWFSAADAYIHLGASLAATQSTETPSGTVVHSTTGDATRLLYVSENPLAQGIAQSAFAGSQMASGDPGVRNVGEQAYAYHAGIPIISASGGSFYFHTEGDEPDGVSPSLLAATAQGFQRSIDDVAALPAGALRQANGVAGALGTSQNPNPTPSGGGGAPGNPADQPQPIASCAGAVSSDHPYPDQSANARPTGLSVAAGLLPTYDDPQPVYSWEGRFQSRTFRTPSAATGAMLYGTIFAPVNLAAGRPDSRFGARRPVVVIGPGSGPGVQAFYQWAARDLAGHGYIALTIDPQGVGYSETFAPGGCQVPSQPDVNAICPGVPFQQAANYVDALRSGIDYALSSRDPWRASVDPGEIGIAGHSLAARAASWLQGADRRVDAAVAWDNLASDLDGDAGSPSGGGTAGDLIGGELPGASAPVTPRVPALGEASDNRGTTEPTNSDPDQKKTAFAVWRKAGKPSMELVFAKAQHTDWGQSATTTAAKAAEIQLFEYYTRAWFDRWLLHDRTATTRLLAPTVDGQSRNAFLSTTFHSAAFLDGQDCENLTAGC